MALQTIKGGLWLPEPDPGGRSTSPSFSSTSTVIDAADEGIAFMIRAPKTGNIAKVLWITRTVTTGATITVRGETWDETTTPAQPSGTLYHANFTGTSVIANTDDNIAVLTTLAAAVAVTKNDKLAIVIKQPNSSPGSMQVGCYADEAIYFPYAMLNTGVSPAVSWASVTAGPIVGLEYDDGSYEQIPGVYPFHAVTTTTFNNGSTPDEIGLRFKITFPARLAGFYLWADADGDYNINVYDTDGATKIAGTPFAVDKDARAASAADLHYYRFTTTANLTKDVFYRIVVEPSSATNLSIYDFTVNTAAAMDAVAGGQNFHLTSAKNPTQESDWTNTTTRRPFMGILLDAFDDGVSAGAAGGFIIGG